MYGFKCFKGLKNEYFKLELRVVQNLASIANLNEEIKRKKKVTQNSIFLKKMQVIFFCPNLKC